MPGGLHQTTARGTAGKDTGARGDGGHVRQARRGCRHPDEDVSARGPGGVQDRRAAHRDLAPGQGDVAAGVALGCADTAVDLDLTLGGGQPDLAAGLADASGLDRSRAVASQDVDVAPSGLERCSRGVDPARDGDVAAPARTGRDIEPADALAGRNDDCVGGGQAGKARSRRDFSGIQHRGANQEDVTFAGDDPAKVDHPGVRLPPGRERTAGEEVGVGDIPRQEADGTAGEDAPLAAHDHALGIHQVDRACSAERPADHRQLAAGHPVQGGALAIEDRDRAALPDGEGPPVDDPAGRSLLDLQVASDGRAYDPGARREGTVRRKLRRPFGISAARKTREDAGEKKEFQFPVTPVSQRAGRTQRERPRLHVLTGRFGNVNLDCHCRTLPQKLAAARN